MIVININLLETSESYFKRNTVFINVHLTCLLDDNINVKLVTYRLGSEICYD